MSRLLMVCPLCRDQIELTPEGAAPEVCPSCQRQLVPLEREPEDVAQHAILDSILHGVKWAAWTVLALAALALLYGAIVYLGHCPNCCQYGKKRIGLAPGRRTWYIAPHGSQAGQNPVDHPVGANGSIPGMYRPSGGGRGDVPRIQPGLTRPGNSMDERPSLSGRRGGVL